MRVHLSAVRKRLEAATEHRTDGLGAVAYEGLIEYALGDVVRNWTARNHSLVMTRPDEEVQALAAHEALGRFRQEAKREQQRAAALAVTIVSLSEPVASFEDGTEETVEEVTFDPRQPSVEEQVLGPDSWVWDEVHRCLSELPPVKRTVLWLVLAEGLSQRDAGASVARSVRTVRRLMESVVPAFLRLLGPYPMRGASVSPGKEV